MIKKCEHCGKEFETKLEVKRFCCRQCKEKASKKRVKNGIRYDNLEFVKTCPVCHQEFVTKYSDKLYCSDKCCNIAVYNKNKDYQKAYHQKLKENGISYTYKYTHKCVVCGQEFEGSKKTLYCPECRKSNKFIKKCKECGKEFIGSTFYCEECNLYRKVENITLYLCECKECGKTFLSTNRYKEYCTNKCKTRYSGRRARMSSSYKLSQKKYHQTKNYKLRQFMVNCLKRILDSKNGESCINYLGYTPNEAKVHLESLFKDGMTWDNYGTVWHIDHVKPLASYNFYNTDGSVNYNTVKIANSLQNLQPMFVQDNLNKGSWYNDCLYQKGKIVKVK